jgi:molybdate transport system ATP-binding protein
MAGLSVELAQEQPIALDVRFTCEPGEMLALVGPSGAGKSTVLRCIAGLHTPARGRVTVDGGVWLDREEGRDVPVHRRKVGYVFQSYALFPHMTALANIVTALGHVAAPDREARAKELLALVRLAGLEERCPQALSGGQQQRVAVARALAREPRVLLLDEPFSAVDKTTRSRLYHELAGMRRRLKMPIVFVTHDLDEALMLADSLCLVHHGRIVQHGEPHDVLNHPSSPEAARLLGHRNIFPGTVTGHNAKEGLTLLDWRGQSLEARHQPEWAPGASVSWFIPPSKVVLHRRGRPSRGEAENPVSGVIENYVELGDMAVSTVRLDGPETRRLTFNVPRHVADRNGLGLGETVGLSLLADAIHVMPPATPRVARRSST